MARVAEQILRLSLGFIASQALRVVADLEIADRLAGGAKSADALSVETGTHTDALFAPNIVGAMADAIEIAMEDPDAALARAKSLRERIFLHFSQKAMVEGGLAGYRDALEASRS